MTRFLLMAAAVVSTVSFASPEPRARRVSAPEFRALMERLARAWSSQDTDLGVACFTTDAVYMQPPDQQLYRTSAELRKYFGALKPGTFMRFENLGFDAARQVGFGEFTFGTEGAPNADHGVAVVELRDGKIAFWREYVQPGPADFGRFVAQEGKAWKWTIETYP